MSRVNDQQKSPAGTRGFFIIQKMLLNQRV